MKTLLLVLSVLMFTGCATGASRRADFERRIDDQIVGKDLNYMLMAWGYPTSHVELDKGRLMLEYKKVGVSYPGQWCTMKVILNKDDKVLGWFDAGPSCGLI